MKVLLGKLCLLFTISISGYFTSTAQQKQVCFSIDDMPLVTYGITDTLVQKEMMYKLVASVKRNNIPAIGFVNEIKLYHRNALNPFQVRLLKHWSDNNLELGNHTFSHPDFNALSLKQYGNDILRGETVTKEILNRKGLQLKYFRHPYLHTGDTKLKSDSLDQFLSDHHYIVAPVTLDNDEYLFALAYKRAKDKKDITLLNQIGADYIDYMEKKLTHFEQQAHKLFGRDIKHILLIHANQLNADYIDALAKMFVRNKYEFVGMDNALTDEAYKTPVSSYGKWGISWIDRWALSQGKKAEFFQGEPEVPDYIITLTK